jgi:D-alanyl-D-alanine carboxypeptidase (penicillin-binding protein 5/6)
MNRQAALLGMSAQTHFSNPHGLADKNNHSTAEDLVHLCKRALQESAIREIVATKTYTCTISNLGN